MDEGEEAEVEKDYVETKGGGGGGVRGLLVLESTGILTQDAEPGETMLVDAHNGLNEVIRLAMLWTVHHC